MLPPCVIVEILAHLVLTTSFTTEQSYCRKETFPSLRLRQRNRLSVECATTRFCFGAVSGQVSDKFL